MNWLAILVAAIAFFAVAAVWYQPKVMGSRWMKAAAVDPSDASPRAWVFVGTFVSYLVMATVLAALSNGLGASSFADGFVLGLFTGVAFVGAQAWVNAAYEGRSMSLVVANGGIGVIGHIVMAIVVTIWN